MLTWYIFVQSFNFSLMVCYVWDEFLKRVFSWAIVCFFFSHLPWLTVFKVIIDILGFLFAIILMACFFFSIFLIPLFLSSCRLLGIWTFFRIASWFIYGVLKYFPYDSFLSVCCRCYNIHIKLIIKLTIVWYFLLLSKILKP